MDQLLLLPSFFFAKDVNLVLNKARIHYILLGYQLYFGYMVIFHGPVFNINVLPEQMEFG